MTYRPDREKRGYCRVIYANGKHQDFKRNEYGPLSAAIRREDAEPWYEAEDLYGDPQLIRLSEVVGVADCSPAAIAAYDAEEDERVAHEKLNGSDN